MPEAERRLPGEPPFQALLALIDPWLEGVPDTVQDRLGRLGPLDWHEVLAHARRHRVVPFVASRLEAIAGCNVPDDVAACFRQEAQAATFHELTMLALLRRVKMSFDNAGIGFLVIKGLVLSSEYHGRMGQRVNHDIDLVVALADLSAAHQLLAGAGWIRVEPVGELDEAAFANWTRRAKDWVYVDSSGRNILELHHRLFDNTTLCEPAIMQRARPVSLFGQLEVRTLGHGDEPAYLALHGALHAWSRLKWLLDMGLVFKALGPGGVSDLLARNKGKAAERALHQAVTLCQGMFATADRLPAVRQPWPTRILTAAACRAMVGSGTLELEDSRFGTTLKNISHYLLWNRAAYWRAELAFDFTDTSRDGLTTSKNVPIWFYRPLAWLSRHRAGRSRPNNSAR